MCSSDLVLLVPVCFFLKIPYIIPIAMGLLSTPLAIISVGCGTVIYYFISYVSLNDTVLGAIEGEAAVQKFRFAMDGILDNKTLIITLIAFSATIITVYVIRRLSIDHAWTVAIIAGTVTNGVILLIGDFIMDSAISILMIFISSAVCLGLATVLQFFTFNVDYSRTEKVQFEDDEYYYYVKAVPKITMSTPQKRVKKINSQRKI